MCWSPSRRVTPGRPSPADLRLGRGARDALFIDASSLFFILSYREVSPHFRRPAQDAASSFCFVSSLIRLLRRLVDERLVNVGNHTTAGDGGLDQGVELLVATDGELEVTGRDALHLLSAGSWMEGNGGG